MTSSLRTLRRSAFAVTIALNILLTPSLLHSTEELLLELMIKEASRYVPRERAIQYTGWIMRVGVEQCCDPALLLSLFITESSLQEDARSSHNYWGIAQTPRHLPAFASIQEGTRIFCDKRRLTNSTLCAISYYKGFAGRITRHTLHVGIINKRMLKGGE